MNLSFEENWIKAEQMTEPCHFLSTIRAWLHADQFRTNLGILFSGVIIMASKMKMFFSTLEKMMLQNQGRPTSDLSVLLRGNFSDAPGHSLIFSAPQTPLVIPSESLPGPSQSPVEKNSNTPVTLEVSEPLHRFHSLYLLLCDTFLPLLLHQT